MQSGSVYIRNVTFSPSGTIGIQTTGGMLTLEDDTIDSCKGGGLLLNGAAFNIKNTTITNNGPSSDLTWGGVKVQALPVSGSATFSLVTIEQNDPSGISCAPGAGITGTGVYAAQNTTGQISSTCNVTSCAQLGTTCGSQQ
jgi:hypothetical protein